MSFGRSPRGVSWRILFGSIAYMTVISCTAVTSAGCSGGNAEMREDAFPLCVAEKIKMYGENGSEALVEIKEPKQGLQWWSIEFPRTKNGGRLILAVSESDRAIVLHALGYDHGVMPLKRAIRLTKQNVADYDGESGKSDSETSDNSLLLTRSTREEIPFGSNAGVLAVRVDIAIQRDRDRDRLLSFWLVPGIGIVKFGKWAGNEMESFHRTL